MNEIHPNDPRIQAPATHDSLHFQYLPAYASYLIEQHLEEYAKVQIKFSREEKVPLLKFFEHLSEQELLDLVLQSSREFLTVFVENTAKEFIEKSVSDFKTNRLPAVTRDQVVALDIATVSLVRRRSLRHFLSVYTNDIVFFANLMEEVDRFIAESETQSFTAYIDIQQEKISLINKELEQRQEELLEAQELADMGSFYWDLQGGQSVYTPGVIKIFELSGNRTLDSFMEHVHEDDREKLRQALDKAFAGGLYECEYRYVKNNTEKKIWSRGRMLFEAGTPVAMKGTLMDVTNKYTLLSKLQASEELHKQAQALTHIGNWSWQIDSGKISWSDEMYRIYGLEPQSEDISFERFVSLIHPADREKRITEIRESLQSGHVRDYSMRIVNPDGTTKVLKGKGEALLNRNGQVTGLVGTCQDVTTEYQLTEVLKEKEAYLQQLISNAPDAVIVIDKEGLVNLWNPKTENIFGWTADEVMGRSLSDIIIPPQHREAHQQGMKRLLETGTSHILNRSLELTALNKQGVEFDISLTISRSVQQGESLFIAFLRDISGEKQTKAELQKKKDELEQLNAALSSKNRELERINQELASFNYVASHDLQEPLRKIQIFSNRLLDTQPSLSDQGVDYLSKILASSEYMQTLMEDLLMFSQIVADESGFEMTDLNMVLDEVKNMLSVRLDEKQAKLESVQLPKIRAIPFQMRQLFLNIIGNAIKYAREDLPPRIEISAAMVPANARPVNGLQPGLSYWRITIKDNGIGFEPENAEKIFDLFKRLHNKDKYSGTGVGLAICRKIVHHHKGGILAVGTPMQGARFSIYFPVFSRSGAAVPASPVS